MVNLFSVLREPGSLAGSLACRIFKAGDQVEIFTKVGQIGKKHRKIPLEFDFQMGIFFGGFLMIFFFSVATRVDPTARTTYCTGMQQLLGACPGGGGVKVALWAMGQLGQLDG